MMPFLPTPKSISTYTEPQVHCTAWLNFSSSIERVVQFKFGLQRWGIVIAIFLLHQELDGGQRLLNLGDLLLQDLSSLQHVHFHKLVFADGLLKFLEHNLHWFSIRNIIFNTFLSRHARHLVLIYSHIGNVPNGMEYLQRMVRLVCLVDWFVLEP